MPIKMAYEWDVFLSYRRYGEWPGWVEKHFYSLLHHWLGEELGDEPKIFFDVQDVETGVRWPPKLARALATSRSMVALWSRQYFRSDWCREELSLMLGREEVSRLALPTFDGGLVVPVLIHDGDDIPDEMKEIQSLRLQKLCNPRMTSDSPTGEQLSEKIRAWVPDVRAAIERAPAWDSSWPGLATQQFASLFQSHHPQKKMPSLGAGS